VEALVTEDAERRELAAPVEVDEEEQVQAALLVELETVLDGVGHVQHGTDQREPAGPVVEVARQVGAVERGLRLGVLGERGRAQHLEVRSHAGHQRPVLVHDLGFGVALAAEVIDRLPGGPVEVLAREAELDDVAEHRLVEVVEQLAALLPHLAREGPGRGDAAAEPPVGLVEGGGDAGPAQPVRADESGEARTHDGDPGLAPRVRECRTGPRQGRGRARHPRHCRGGQAPEELAAADPPPRSRVLQPATRSSAAGVESRHAFAKRAIRIARATPAKNRVRISAPPRRGSPAVAPEPVAAAPAPRPVPRSGPSRGSPGGRVAVNPSIGLGGVARRSEARQVLGDHRHARGLLASSRASSRTSTGRSDSASSAATSARPGATACEEAAAHSGRLGC
jgi:hypothetical protein